MTCARCKKEMLCVDTAHAGGAVYRLRQCPKCCETFTTIEVLMDTTHPIYPEAYKRPRIAAAVKRIDKCR